MHRFRVIRYGNKKLCRTYKKYSKSSQNLNVFATVSNGSQKILEFFILKFTVISLTFIPSIVEHSTVLTSSWNSSTQNHFGLLCISIVIMLHPCMKNHWIRIINQLNKISCLHSIQNAGTISTMFDSKKMWITTFCWPLKC